MKKTIHIEYQLKIDSLDDIYYLSPALCVQNTNLINYNYVNCIDVDISDIKCVDVKNYNYIVNNNFETIQDKICCLRLHAEFIEKLSEIKPINIDVSFNLDEKTNKCSFRILKYTGDVCFKKRIKEILDNFCGSIKSIKKFKKEI